MESIYLYLAIYVGLLFIISYFVSKKQDEEDFLISGRNRGSWQILASKFAASIGAGYFITYTGFAYEYGFGVFALLIGTAFGYLLFGYWAAPKVHERSKKNKFYTMGDFVYYVTKSKAALYLTNALSSVILFGWLLVGVIGGAKIINDFGLLSYNIAVLLTVGVVLVYILIAGFKAVIITDIIQSIIIFALLILVTFGIVGTDITTLIFTKTGPLDIGVAVGFFLFGLLAVFSFSNYYQLCYAAKTKRKLQHGIGLAIVPVLLVAFFLLFIGLFMASQTIGLDSGLVFTEALKRFLPASLLPLAVVLFFAGIMSSADTNIYAISSHYVLSTHHKSPIKSIRMATIVLMVITTVIAFVFTDIVDVSIIAGGLSVTLSLPMLYLFFKKKNARRFIWSAVGGVLGLIVGIFFLGIEPVVVLAVLLGNIVGLVVGGFFRG